MTDFEHRATSLLRGVERMYRIKSSTVRSLADFSFCDLVRVTLTNELDPQATPLIISGALIVPEKSLIQAYRADGLPQLIGRNAFFATRYAKEQPDGSADYETHLEAIAGGHGFAYYFPEDTDPNKLFPNGTTKNWREGRGTTSTVDNLVANSTKSNVKHTSFIYTKLEVKDCVIFDHGDPINQQTL